MATPKVIVCGKLAIAIPVPDVATQPPLTAEQEVLLALDEERAGLRRQLEQANTRIAELEADKLNLQEQLANAPEQVWAYLREKGIEFYELGPDDDPPSDMTDEQTEQMVGRTRKLIYCQDSGDPSVGIDGTVWWQTTDGQFVKLAADNHGLRGIVDARLTLADGVVAKLGDSAWHPLNFYGEPRDPTEGTIVESEAGGEYAVQLMLTGHNPTIETLCERTLDSCYSSLEVAHAAKAPQPPEDPA